MYVCVCVIHERLSVCNYVFLNGFNCTRLSTLEQRKKLKFTFSWPKQEYVLNIFTHKYWIGQGCHYQTFFFVKNYYQNVIHCCWLKVSIKYCHQSFDTVIQLKRLLESWWKWLALNCCYYSLIIWWQHSGRTIEIRLEQAPIFF
jgi:hypothetical protein